MLITEIFQSIQGESTFAGLPCVFVRLTGCNLRCRWCDTEYAFHGGEWWDINAIIEQVVAYGVLQVCVTGGEPLAQPNCRRLLEALCDAGFEVSLETSGALDIAVVDPRVTVVMDLKTPGSGECERNRWENLAALKPQDQLKFVICDRQDYQWSKEQIDKHKLIDRCAVLFSTSHDELKARELAEWILEDRLQVRFQLQLHKYLWGDEPGRP